MQNSNVIIKFVILSIRDTKLTILLKDNNLIKDTFAEHSSLDEVAKHIFSTTTQLPMANNYLEQLYTIQEDTGISIVYYLLLPYKNFSLPKNLFRKQNIFQKNHLTFQLFSMLYSGFDGKLN